MDVRRLAAALLAALLTTFAFDDADAARVPARHSTGPIARLATPKQKLQRPVSSKTNLPKPMEVAIVRAATPGCGQSCAEWIAADGMITTATVARFKLVFERLGNRKLPILVNSLGGSVPDAYVIGRMIRAKGLDVGVGETEFLPCHELEADCARFKKEGVRFGTPHDLNAKCVSACPFLLAAGVRRVVGRTSLVGVHEFASYQTTIRILRKYRVTTKKSFWGPDKQTKTLISEKKVGESTERVATREVDYEKARRYFVEMGVADSIMPLVHKARHESLHVLTPSELQSTKLMTEAAALDTLLDAAKEPQAVKAEVPIVEPVKALKKNEAPKRSATAPSRKRSARVVP